MVGLSLSYNAYEINNMCLRYDINRRKNSKKAMTIKFQKKTKLLLYEGTMGFFFLFFLIRIWIKFGGNGKN